MIFVTGDQHFFHRNIIRYCVAPETPILMADLSWRPAGDIACMDALIGVEEYAGGRRRQRRFCTGRVTHAQPFVSLRLRVRTTLGEVVVSHDHNFLVQPAGGTDKEWRRIHLTPHPHYGYRPVLSSLLWMAAKDLRPGMRIVSIGRPWHREESWEAGRLAGLYDGEGSLSVLTNQYNAAAVQLGFSQKPGAVLAHGTAALRARGIHYQVYTRSSSSVKSVVIQGLPLVMPLLGTLGPKRLIAKLIQATEAERLILPRRFVQVTSVALLGQGELVNIGTTCGTLITNGLVSHNCRRPFADVQAMNDCLERNWNDMVVPTDTVYCLGDFAFLSSEHQLDGMNLFVRLKGRKHLVKGNHDRGLVLTLGWDKIHLEPVLLDGVVLTHHGDHYMRQNPAVESQQVVFCAHVHALWQVRANMLNVGVDCNHFRPWSFEEAKDYWQYRYDYWQAHERDA